MVQCCLPKDSPGDPLGPKQVLLEGSKDPACWFSEWCDVAKSLQNTRNPSKSQEFGAGWFPQQLCLALWVVKHFCLVLCHLVVESIPSQGSGFPEKKRDSENHMPENYEPRIITSFYHIQLRISFPSSMIVLESKTDVLFGYQLPNQNPTRHPGHWASIRGWDLQGLWTKNTCIDDTK